MQAQKHTKSEYVVSATVITTSPLTVRVDGADTAAPASKVNGLTVTANSRVTMTVRDPVQSMITAVEVLA